MSCRHVFQCPLYSSVCVCSVVTGRYELNVLIKLVADHNVCRCALIIGITYLICDLVANFYSSQLSGGVLHSLVRIGRIRYELVIALIRAGFLL